MTVSGSKATWVALADQPLEGDTLNGERGLYGKKQATVRGGEVGNVIRPSG